MAVNIFPAPSGVVTTWFSLSNTGMDVRFSSALQPGLYEIESWAQTAATVTGAIKFFSATGTELAQASFLDYDTGSTANSSKVFVNLTSEAAFIQANLSAVCNISVTRYSNATFGRIVATYTSSSSVTIPAGCTVFLLGGGGGGAGGGFQVGTAGSGGGSGYWTTTNPPAGTYSFTVGAGGAFGNYAGSAPGAGGSTTFNGVTAAGGSPGGVGAAGGAGGSGGGGMSNNGTAPGAGGNNGSSGSAGATSAGGAGSGVAVPINPIFNLTSVPQPTGVDARGTAGGFAAGGNGGSYGAGGGGGGAAAGTGGGGGGASGTSGSGPNGGAGGSGLVAILGPA